MDELIKELKRLREWWDTDAKYRPPEDPLLIYALGYRDALDHIIKLIEET